MIKEIGILTLIAGILIFLPFIGGIIWLIFEAIISCFNKPKTPHFQHWD